MDWTDRLKKASYESPSGEVFDFQYEDVSVEVDKKTTAFNFASSNETYVQQNGKTSRRYPLICYFWGSDYDIESESFMKALEEDGLGKLTHPIYGNINVVPFGGIKRKDNLKTASNQAIFEITFFNTTNIVYPNSQSDTESLLLNSIEEYNEATATYMEDVLDLSTEVKKSGFKSVMTGIATTTANGLKFLLKESENVENQFNTISQSILTGMDDLVDTPFTLVSQVIKLTQLPSLAIASFTSKLSNYGTLMDSILGIVPSNNNEFQSLNFNVSTMLVSLANASIDTITRSNLNNSWFFS